MQKTKLTFAFAVGDDAASPEGALERGDRRVLGFIFEYSNNNNGWKDHKCNTENTLTKVEHQTQTLKLRKKTEMAENKGEMRRNRYMNSLCCDHGTVQMEVFHLQTDRQ